VLIILKSYDLEKVRYKIPKIAMMAAVMLITMSVPLGFIPFHMNFAALAGIILGPAISFVSIFVVNFVLALLGHGGITVVGINTVFIGAEAVLGGVLFRLLKSKFGTTISAAISTAAALLLSTILVLLFLNSIGVVDIWSGEGLLHAHDGEGNHHHGHSSFHIGSIVLTGWGAVLTVVLAGIVLETVITILIIRFFQKMQSDLVQPLSGRK